MALTITSTLTTPQGFELTNAYVRVTSQDEYTGNQVTGFMNIYPSEQAFIDGKDPILFPNLSYAAGAYNREVDGSDTLDFAHDLLIAAMASVGITAVKVL